MDEDSPGKRMDERYETLLAKVTETSEALDREIAFRKNLQREVQLIRQQLPPERKPCT